MYSANIQKDSCLSSVSSNIDDTVGVQKRLWFIAILNNHTEKSAAEKLTRLGMENYLPTQTEFRVSKSGKRTKVDKILIPAKIFIYCTEQERRELVYLPFINRFMTNIAGARGTSAKRPLAVIPEEQIVKLKFILGASDKDVSFSEHLVKGQKIEVVRGSLKGFVGVMSEDIDSGLTRLSVNILSLGCASVIINPKDIKNLNDSTYC